MKKAFFGAALAAALANDPKAIKPPWWKMLRFFGGDGSRSFASRSKYKPHQGEREKARRIKQMGVRS